jgi:hypothetical protein
MYVCMYVCMCSICMCMPIASSEPAHDTDARMLSSLHVKVCGCMYVCMGVCM